MRLGTAIWGMHIAWLISAAAVVVATDSRPVNAQATLIASNLSAGVTSGHTTSPTTYLAQAFDTDNRAYRLTSITLLLWEFSGDPTAVVELRAHDSATNAPVGGVTGLLSDFTTSNGAGFFTPISFAPLSTVTLQPNTRYWVTLRTADNFSGSLQWINYGNPFVTEGPGFIPRRRATTQDGGDTWTGFDNFVYLMRVSGVAAPEPASLALLLFPALLLASRRTRR